ncbi:YlbF family regulator [Halococcus hamelinensis]|uniref:YlbF family regulator n=1 Tax=Halococcus hamelinensis 100A6 TaxID=1132509 RepID=M0LY45_9EURY|nr:YlbF family regulator [Halococcus hamelinensis]EMA38088.1 hypothetical protein C447_10175 [Halococcus hamelinensis 100A6]
MSTEPDVETGVDPARTPEAVAEELGAAIAATDEYERYVETKTAVEESREAQEKVREFERLRDAFVQAREVGEATEEDRDTLKNAQRELHALPEMADYLAAQQELDARLERLDTAIGTDLDVDFGDRIGSCCQD